jgi:hypothetical protein
MPMILLLSFLLTPVFAAEVATLDLSKPTNEIVLILTDPSLETPLDKKFTASSCGFRYGMATTGMIRMNYFSRNCKAQVIQFLLTNDYKPDAYHRVFTK